MIKRIFLVFTLFTIWPLPTLSETPTPTKSYVVFGGTSSTPTLSTRVNSKRWNTYLNQNYGFSVQYLWGIDDFLPKPESHDFGVTAITLPTVNDKGPIGLTTFTDDSIKKSDESMLKDDSGENDGELFKYSIKGLREDLKLPVGSVCKTTKDGKVVDFNGVKAILLILDPHGSWGIEKKYFIPRGGTRWLEIDIQSFDNEKNPFLSEKVKRVLTPELRKEKERALEVVLRTFKFFEPEK